MYSATDSGEWLGQGPDVTADGPGVGSAVGRDVEPGFEGEGAADVAADSLGNGYGEETSPSPQPTVKIAITTYEANARIFPSRHQTLGGRKCYAPVSADRRVSSGRALLQEDAPEHVDGLRDRAI